MSTFTPAEMLAELVDAAPSMSPDKLRADLAHVWPSLHAPLRFHGTAALVAMFKQAGYVSDGPPMPEADLVIYRGEPANLASPGIAWSAGHATATDYARRYSTAGSTRVLRAIASPKAQRYRASRCTHERPHLPAPGRHHDAGCLVG